MRGHCCCCCCINLFIQTDKILLLLSAVSVQCSDVLHEYGHRAADTILGLLNKHLLDNNQCYEHARGAGHGSCSGERPRLHPHPSPNSRIWLTAWAGQRGKMARWQAARWHLPLAPGWPVLAQEPHCRNNHHTVPALPSDPLTLYIYYTLNTLTYTDILLLEWARETIDVLEMRNSPSKTTGEAHKTMDKATETRYTIHLLHDKFPTIAKLMQNIECGCCAAGGGRGWGSFVHWIIFHVSCLSRCHHRIISTQILHVSGPRMCTGGLKEKGDP